MKLNQRVGERSHLAEKDKKEVSKVLSKKRCISEETH